MRSELLTTVEAAEYLGYDFFLDGTVVGRKEIVFYKPNGKLCFFDKNDLDQWQRRIRVSSQEEIDREAIAYVTQRDLLK